MQMPPETQVVIDFDDNRGASALVGPYGQNLALIERRLGVVVDSRGNHISIAGSRDGCDAARRVLETLYAQATQGHELSQGDVEGAIRAVIANAEPLRAAQRRNIEAAFRCPVRETYGLSEIVAAANECEHGAMHLWPAAGVLEILDDGRPVAAGAAGELVSTGLMNPDMPLIRYRTGDRCSLGAEQADCPCGRTLPLLGSIEGRCDDIIYTRDGRRVGRLDPIFKASLPSQEAQIVQETSLSSYLAERSPDRLLVFCDEEAEVADPLAVLRDAKCKLGNVPSLALLIGPEGGFDPAEREALLAAANVLPISLGPRILRADTAAVAGLALLQAVLGDWTGAQPRTTMSP